MNMATLHGRRHRRQAKQALRFGKSAKPTHKLRAGRTGSVHTKKRGNKEAGA